MKLNMRWMSKRDIPSILRMQKSCFNSPKFDREFFTSVVTSRKSPSFGAEGHESYVSYVCDIDKKAVGYVVYKVDVLSFEKGLHSSNMVGLKNALPMAGEIVSFCVDEPFRLQGVGRYIISSVLNRFSSVVELSLKEVKPRPFLVYAVCSEKDLGLHLFFRSIGFTGRNVLRNAFGEGHDAYTMVYENLSDNKFIVQCCEEALK